MQSSAQRRSDMGEPAIIMYDKPRPGCKPLDAGALRMVRPLGRGERAFLVALGEAPVRGVTDTEKAKGIMCSVLSVPREALDSESNFYTAMHFVLPPARRAHAVYSPFMNLEGGADTVALARPLQTAESRFLAALSVAPGNTVDEIERAKTLLAEVLGIPRAQLECPRAYSNAMDSVLPRA